MKVALSGASGLLGPPLVRRLLDAGHAVHVLARDVKRALGRLPPGVTGSFFDATTPLSPEALAGAEAVVHLAGEPVAQRWTAAARQRIQDSRVVGTRLLVEALRTAGTVRHFVSASAIGYYGADRGEEPLTETGAPGDDFLAWVCRGWEAEALEAEHAGIRTVVARIGVVLHPSGGALGTMLPLFRLGLGGRMGSGRQYLSWVHLEDAVGLLHHALEREDLRGPMNVTAPEPVTNARFAQALGAALGRPALVPVPAFALKLALGDMSVTALGGQRVLPERARETGYAFRQPELSEALRSLLG
ncbi:Cell division inhibitor [Cystobacter fuscus DSM 2262]|uniref:Cell division inhibitor n=1 Tax=Cystobacter fuscus (strain ATCC 25194 / DSM 2262 / NBRC 100088 / M29) TaxID=1242864 RepID=S9Q1X8_CYSF2|nr:TIGR01777 family oxidoreductase [Cystobacter fuscus]EPX55309.1 Cell division inhibitor [Cystobacter fuscus DSM 2262]